MKILIEATVVVAITLLTLSAIRSQPSSQQIAPIECVQPLSSADNALADTIHTYLKYIGNYEIPVVAIQERGDTTHYIISALISTYSIKKNPPTSIVELVDREALLYTGKASIVQTAPNCYKSLLKKYGQLLHIDKINRRDGISPNKPQAYAYDPILKDISVSKDGYIKVKSVEHFPFTKDK